MTSGSPTLRDYVLLALLSVCWGSAFAMIEVAVQDLPPPAVVAGRLALAAMLLILWLRVRGRALPRLLPVPDMAWAWFMALGLLGNALPFIFVALGQTGTESNVAAIITGLLPLVIAVAAHFAFATERLTPLAIAGLILGFAGIVVLFAPRLMESGLAGGWGEALILLSLFSYAANNIVARLSPDVSPDVTAAGSVLCAAIVMAPWGLWTLRTVSEVGAGPVMAVIGLGLFPTALAAILFMVLVRRQGARFPGLANYGVPVVGSILGFALGEALPPTAIIALGLVLAGVLLGGRKRFAVRQD